MQIVQRFPGCFDGVAVLLGLLLHLLDSLFQIGFRFVFPDARFLQPGLTGSNAGFDGGQFRIGGMQCIGSLSMKLFRCFHGFFGDGFSRKFSGMRM